MKIEQLGCKILEIGVMTTQIFVSIVGDNIQQKLTCSLYFFKTIIVLDWVKIDSLGTNGLNQWPLKINSNRSI